MELESILAGVVLTVLVGGMLWSSVRARRERRKKDRAYLGLGRANRRMRAMFEKSKVAKTESIPGYGRIQTANAAFCELVGYTQDEICGLTWRELSHPEDHGRASEPVNAMIEAVKAGEDPDPVSFFVRYVAKDGVVAPAFVHVTFVAGDEADDPGVLLAEVQSTEEISLHHRELVHEGLAHVTGPIHL